MRALRSGQVEQGIVTQDEVHYAEAAIPYDGGAHVLLLRDSLEDQLGSVHLVQRRVLFSAGVALADRPAARLRRGLDLRAPYPPARARGGPDRGRPVRRASDDSGGDELGELAARVRPYARPARSARRRPARVHRQCVARAADAAVLAGRLPGAARRRGARRADAPRVPRIDARSGRPADEARDRPARPLAAGCRPFARGARAGRPRRARPGRRRRVPAGCGGHGARARARRRRARSRSRTSCACSRSAASSSRTRSGTRLRARRSA